MMERIEDLLGLRKKRKVAAVLWCVQGDAAAKVGAEVDGSDGAPKLGDTRKMKQKGTKGKRNDPSVLFIKQGTWVTRKNQGAASLQTELSPRLSQIY